MSLPKYRFLFYLLTILTLFSQFTNSFHSLFLAQCFYFSYPPSARWVRYPVWQHTFVSPSAFSRRAVVSYWRKYVQEVLVNRLGGLSLPRKSVVRLTDRPDMTLDVYRGRKTPKQQQQKPFSTWCMSEPVCRGVIRK